MMPLSIVPVLGAVVKSALLLGAAFALLRAMCRSTAAVRHVVSLSALAGAVLIVPLSLAPASFGVALQVPVAAASASAGPVESAGVNWAAVFAWVWLGGALLFAARYAIAVALIRRTVRRATRVDDPAWMAALGDALDHLGLGARRVGIRSADVHSPVICGLFRPVILIPRQASGWGRAQRRSVLLHELAHLGRRDLWANAAAAMATAVYWFNPLVWMLARRMRAEQEFACDDRVLSAGVAPSSYAEILLESVSASPSGALFSCAMKSGSLKARMAHILDAARPRITRRVMIARAGVAVGACALVLGSLKPITASAEQVYKIGGDVVAPKLIQKVEPKYTDEARDAKIQGTVVLKVVIGTDGKVRDPEIVQSLDRGLDHNAITALEQWVFEPGRKKGEPVAVRAKIEINFRLY